MSEPASFPSFHALVKSMPERPDDFSSRHFFLIATLVRLQAVGIADMEDPEAAESAKKTIGEAYYRLARCLKAFGVVDANDMIPAQEWQHRPADKTRNDFLEAGSILNRNIERVAMICGSFAAGRTKMQTTAQAVFTVYLQIGAALKTICGALRISPRLCAEHYAKALR